MGWLDEVIQEIDRRGGAKPISKQEELRRIREQIQALLEKIVSVSPGHEKRVSRKLLLRAPLQSFTQDYDELMALADARYPGIVEGLMERMRAEEKVMHEVPGASEIWEGGGS